MALDLSKYVPLHGDIKKDLALAESELDGAKAAMAAAQTAFDAATDKAASLRAMLTNLERLPEVAAEVSK